MTVSDSSGSGDSKAVAGDTEPTVPTSAPPSSIDSE
jgi:hypothetical protein